MNHARRRRVRGRQVYVDQGGWRIREALQLRRLRVEDLECEVSCPQMAIRR